MKSRAPKSRVPISTILLSRRWQRPCQHLGALRRYLGSSTAVGTVGQRCVIRILPGPFFGCLPFRSCRIRHRTRRDADSGARARVRVGGGGVDDVIRTMSDDIGVGALMVVGTSDVVVWCRRLFSVASRLCWQRRQNNMMMISMWLLPGIVRTMRSSTMVWVVRRRRRVVSSRMRYVRWRVRTRRICMTRGIVWLRSLAFVRGGDGWLAQLSSLAMAASLLIRARSLWGHVVGNARQLGRWCRLDPTRPRHVVRAALKWLLWMTVTVPCLVPCLRLELEQSLQVPRTLRQRVLRV